MVLRLGDKTKLNEEGKQNECYKNWKDEILIVVDIAYSGLGYDKGLSPMPLYSFKFEDGTDCPNSLYGYEVEDGE